MQLEFFDVPSPCVGVCQSNEKGFCLGCMRSRDERLNWKALDNDSKQKVIKRCIQRKKRQESKNKKEALKNQSDTVENSEPKTDEENDIIQPSLLDSPSKVKIDLSQDLDFGDFEL